VAKYYYVTQRHVAGSCGHAHRELGPPVAKCWRGVGQVWEVRDDGHHVQLQGGQLEPLRAFFSTRGPGRPAGQTPRIEQASPLYARLSVPERQRYESVAKAAGMELGAFALHLLERAASEQDAGNKNQADR
jgi:hypothetical protein